MDEGLDTGNMIFKAEVEISETETGESLHDKLATTGAGLCVKTLEALLHGEATFERQGETTTPYAKMLTKEMGNIDWTKSAVDIERLVRGLNSWPCAYTYWGDKMLKIWMAKADMQSNANDGDASVQPGTVTTVTKDGFSVQTGEGILNILELQIPGKKRMQADAFLRGYPLSTGTVFAS